MKLVEKITATGVVTFIVGIFLFAVCYTIVDLRYTFGGVVINANITAVAKEFSGFANDDVRGTEPTYRYSLTYTFEACGERLSGEASTSSAIAAIA